MVGSYICLVRFPKCLGSIVLISNRKISINCEERDTVVSSIVLQCSSIRRLPSIHSFFFTYILTSLNNKLLFWWGRTHFDWDINFDNSVYIRSSRSIYHRPCSRAYWITVCCRVTRFSTYAVSEIRYFLIGRLKSFAQTGFLVASVFIRKHS